MGKIRTKALLLALIAICSACSSKTISLVDREPLYYRSPLQVEIDSLREEMANNSKWGRGETKPWNERYKTHNSELPYLGPMDSQGLYQY